jgi:hypothetical protein
MLKQKIVYVSPAMEIEPIIKSCTLVQENYSTVVEKHAKKNNKVQSKKAYERKIYISRVMANMMQATTSNSTSIHFGFGHMCKDHN